MTYDEFVRSLPRRDRAGAIAQRIECERAGLSPRTAAELAAAITLGDLGFEPAMARRMAKKIEAGEQREREGGRE